MQSLLTRLLLGGGGGFSPAALFSSGAEGVWYDPSDTSTLFQDPAGATPVTAVEQPVGLMLDKSKGLVLGPELFSGFTSTGTWTVSGSTYSISAAATATDLRVDYVGTTGKRYLISFTASNVSGAILFYPLNTSPQSTVVNGQNTIRESSNAGFFIIRAGAGASATISNISVRELPGNHAISYNSTTARPTLSARVNLLTYSEQFDNAAWTLAALNAFGSGSVANTTATLDPIGGNTADFIQENTANTTHEVYQQFTVAASVRYTYSVRIKAAGRTWCQFVLGPSTYFGSAGVIAYFDVANGVVGTVTSNATALPVATIASLGNGWYQCTLSVTSNAATGTAQCYVRVAQNGSTVSYTGDGTSGIYIWGADLRPANIGSAIPSYQRIAAATDYDTNGFPKYLYFAGTDDGMSTPANLNLTSTDKVTVFSGVRKLSDAVAGVLTELSAAVASNNGTFAIVAPTAVVANSYNWTSRGTLGVDNAVVNAFTAPVTGVITGIADIAAPVSTNRLSGAVLQTLTTSQGTGNYGSYPLYIGSRNNASAWFNGYLYGLTVVGAQLTTPQIESMETWTAQRTGITL